MIGIGGYSSDINLNNVPLIGDFPADHNIGGFGEALGTDNYTITLTPAIKSYRPGLKILARFQNTNTGLVSVNIDGLGFIRVKKEDEGMIVDMEADDLDTVSIYQLTNNGGIFLITLPRLKASLAEVNLEINNRKYITPFTLAQYVAGKITNLWEDKGLIDCSTNPDYPAGMTGDAYTVSVAGKIGGAGGVVVDVRDVIYCINDNPGGSQAAVGSDWNVIQSNLVAATELIAGILRISTTAEAFAGVIDNAAITPLKLAKVLAVVIVPATTLVAGIQRNATNAEAIAGILANATITPASLAAVLAGLPTPNVTKLLFVALGTESNDPVGTGELVVGSTYSMPAGTLSGNNGLRIRSVCFTQGGGTKIFRIRIGGVVVAVATTTSSGDFNITVEAFRLNNTTMKGGYQFIGVVQIGDNIQPAGFNFSGAAHLIELTVEVAAPTIGALNRFTFTVEKLV